MQNPDFRSYAKNLLFVDIETVAGYAGFSDVPERLQKEWLRKAAYLKNDENLSGEDLFFKRAAVYPEFGKIVTIGMGFFHWDETDTLTLRVRTLESHDETELLRNFAGILEKRKATVLVAHNGKEFDYPYLCRRMLVNGVLIPKNLWNPAWKRFDFPHLDTMELWKFGDYKHFTSLELLAAIFEIPSSKDTLSGDQVTPAYYRGELSAIARYCREDVVVLAQLFLCYQQVPRVLDENIIRLE